MERPPTGWPLARVLARDWIFAWHSIAHWQHHDAEAGPARRPVDFISLFKLRRFKLACIDFNYVLASFVYRKSVISHGERKIYRRVGCIGDISWSGACTAIIFSCMGSDHTRADPHDRTLAPPTWAHTKRHAVLRWNFYYLRSSYMRIFLFIDQPCVDDRGHGVRPRRAAQNFALAHGVRGVGAASCNDFSFGVVCVFNGCWILEHL